jgi:hypothetical protein
LTHKSLCGILHLLHCGLFFHCKDILKYFFGMPQTFMGQMWIVYCILAFPVKKYNSWRVVRDLFIETIIIIYFLNCDTVTTKTQQIPNFSPILGLIYSLKLSLSSTSSFFFFFFFFFLNLTLKGRSWVFIGCMLCL